MAVMIGSARMGENGSITGGRPGDQKQKATPDTKGEVSLQPFYAHKKGWHVLRPKQKDVAARLAIAMNNACNNPMIGYNQNSRADIIKYGTTTRTYINCDCSSLVRRCVMEASGKDPGNFTTATEAAALEKTGLFEKRFSYRDLVTTPLKTGDVLVTKTKGHTAIVVSAMPFEEAKDIQTIAMEVRDGKWGNGSERRRRLTENGYNYTEIQKLVNDMLKK